MAKQEVDRRPLDEIELAAIVDKKFPNERLGKVRDIFVFCRYTKEIADLCGIERNITFHLARHTFAATVTLSNNVPIESVSKMLVHKDLRTTQHYAKIIDKKVSNDMEALRFKLESKGI